jgi:AcrR family transcriptional regulator
MGKIDENKRKKKEALFNTAYELFTTKGITSTTISDIVEKAKVAKGTFYLYFTNKYDIKNKLVVHKTQELFDAAGAALEKEQIHGLEDQMIFLIDHLINSLKDDKALLNFISKNLVMGALRSALLTGENSDREIYNHFLKLVVADDYEYKDVDVMLFTIVELAGSAGYNSMMYEEPIPIDDYKPFLYRTVRLIIGSHRADAKMELKI